MKNLNYLKNNWFYILLVIVLYFINMYFSVKDFKTSISSSSFTTTSIPPKTVNTSNKIKSLAKSVDSTYKNTPYEPYIKELQQKIKKNWNPQILNQDKIAIVIFDINKNGTISRIAIKQSSGNKEFDNNAIKAIKKSAPFAPLSDFYEDNRLTIEFTFDYHAYKH